VRTCRGESPRSYRVLQIQGWLGLLLHGSDLLGDLRVIHLDDLRVQRFLMQQRLFDKPLKRDGPVELSSPG
jgi:hypothetical protein